MSLTPPKMAATTGSWYDYVVTDFWEINGDHLAKLVPLCDRGPWRIAAIVSVYLVFVLYLGPRLMRNREPFKLTRTIFWYDVFHVVANGGCSLYALYVTRGLVDCWGCKSTGSADNYWDKTNLALAFAYFLAKCQVLHVAHHAVMPFAAYSAIKFAPVGRTAFVGIINSMVHTIMYLYYALASYGPSMHKHLWWKSYITTIQMVQFVAIIVHSIQGAFFIPCQFPVIISVLEFLHGFFFLKSFYAFFKKEYKTQDTEQLVDGPRHDFKSKGA
ncbi:putative protein for very long chain fatty acid elongation [Halotydeus destructor]|nr:putative protein for very long chain fatty acid elongation [Halotydeus destructor]